MDFTKSTLNTRLSGLRDSYDKAVQKTLVMLKKAKTLDELSGMIEEYTGEDSPGFEDAASYAAWLILDGMGGDSGEYSKIFAFIDYEGEIDSVDTLEYLMEETDFDTELSDLPPQISKECKRLNKTGNLSEANKYFFGTENPKEVKKLFESVE